jgi:hypothetical protein
VLIITTTVLSKYPATGENDSRLILKRGKLSRSSGQWRDDDYDVLENGVVVGRIFFLDAVGPKDRPWMWASVHNGDIKRGTRLRANPRNSSTPDAPATVASCGASHSCDE